MDEESIQNKLSASRYIQHCTEYKKLYGVLPCPRCGNTNIMMKIDYFRHLYTVYCHDIEKCGITQIGFTTEDEAIKVWNRRT